MAKDVGQAQVFPCPRCFSREPPHRPWRGFKVIRVLWLAGMAGYLCLLPFLMMDIVFSIPLFFVYGVAAGPVFRFAAEQPTCRACGLGRPHPERYERPIRPVRAVESGSSSTQLSAPATFRRRASAPGQRRGGGRRLTDRTADRRSSSQRGLLRCVPRE